jgi:hypothetical protein
MNRHERKTMNSVRKVLTSALLCLPLILIFHQNACGYYDPGVGRWINRDPVEDQDSPSLYSALQNRPVNFIDAWGEDVVDPGSVNCLGYAIDFGYTLAPDPSQSLKQLLEEWGWKCKGPTKRKCKGKKEERVIVIYVYDPSGFPKGANPWTSPWPGSGDFHSIKRCPDGQWRYIPQRCPLGTPPSPTPNPIDPDSYWRSRGESIPRERYCCTKR